MNGPDRGADVLIMSRDLLETVIAGHIRNATENAFEVGRKFGRNETRKEIEKMRTETILRRWDGVLRRLGDE
jgi:hypothetical protein